MGDTTYDKSDLAGIDATLAKAQPQTQTAPQQAAPAAPAQASPESPAEGAAQYDQEDLKGIDETLKSVGENTQSLPQKLLKGTIEYGRNMAKESRHGKGAAAGALAGAGAGLANLGDIAPDILGGIQKQITPPEVYDAMSKHGLVAGGSPLTTAYEKLHPVKKAKQASPAFYGTGAAVAPMAVPLGGGEQTGARMLQAAGNIPGVGGIAGTAHALVRMAPGSVGRTALAAIGNAPLAATLAVSDLSRAGKPLTPQNLIAAAAPYIAAGTALHAIGEVGHGIAKRSARQAVAPAPQPVGTYDVAPAPQPVGTYDVAPGARAPEPGQQFRQQNAPVVTPGKAAPVNATEGIGSRKLPLSKEEARAKFQQSTAGTVTPPKPVRGPAAQQLEQSNEALAEPKSGQVDYGNRNEKLAAIEKESIPAPPLESLGKKAAKAKEVLNNLAMKARSINDQEEKVRAYARAINNLVRARGGQANAELNKDITLTEDAKAAAEAGVRGYGKVPNKSYVETVPHESSKGISESEQKKINRTLVKPEAPKELAKGFAEAHDRLQALERERDTYRQEHEDLIHEAVPFGTHLTEGETTFHHKQTWSDSLGTKTEKAAAAIVKQRKAQAAENPSNIAFTRDSRYQKMHLNRQYQTALDTIKGKVSQEEYKAWEDGLEYLKRGNTSGAQLAVFEPITPALAKAVQYVSKAVKGLTPEDGLRLTGTFHTFDIYKRYDPALFKAMEEKVAQLTQVSGGEVLARNAAERQLFKNSRSLDYEKILTGKKGMDALTLETREYLTRCNAILDDMKDILKTRREKLYGKGAKFSNWDFFNDKVLGLAIQKDLEQLSGKGFSPPLLDGLFGSIVQGRVQVGQQHLLEALIVNTANDPKAMASLMGAVKEDPRIWKFTEMYHGNGPLRDAYESAMEGFNPLRKPWAEADRKINGPWMNRMAELMGKEHAETLKGLVSNVIPERFKGQVTRAIALTNTAKDMGMKAGDLAQLLMDDAESFKRLGTGRQLSQADAAKALEAHISIAHEMYERLGWGAPGYRHLGVFQYMPGLVYAAPFKIQAINQSAAMNRMWFRGLKAVTSGDIPEAQKQFRKLLTYNVLNATLLGPKAIPREILAAMSFVAPAFTKQFINVMQNMAFVGKILQAEPTHLQPAIAPVAQVDPGFLKTAVDIYQHVTGQDKHRPPETDQEKEAANKRFIHQGLYVAALAGAATLFDSTMGTEELFNIANHLYEGKKGQRTTWAFSGAPAAQFLGKRKEHTNLVENLYHAFVPGERPDDERFIEQMNNNYAAKLHVQWFYPEEFKALDAQAKKIEAMPRAKGLPREAARIANKRIKEEAQRTPLRSFDWVDAANRLDSGRIHGIWKFLTGHHAPEA